MLSDSLLNLRQEDLRRVLSDQTKSVLLERIDRFYLQMEQQGLPKNKINTDTRDQLVIHVEKIFSLSQSYNLDKATLTLNEFEDIVAKWEDAGYGSEYPRFAFELIHQIKQYLERSGEIINPTNPKMGSLLGPSEPFNKIQPSPTSIEDILSPLSNSWRIGIIQHLSDDDESLAGLSKALGLKKGHLQFHLNSLLSMKYIHYNRKSHLYSITDRGVVALDEITKLVDRLTSLCE
jgi:DNA-binding HxlR family transcriptional regulator